MANRLHGPRHGPAAEPDTAGALWRPTPNVGPRRGGARPRLIVLHYTAMADAEAALERLSDPVHAVSAHYLVGRDGCLWQLAREADRAWHAGAGAWGGITDVNSASLGVEIDNDGASPFSEPAMARLEALLDDFRARHAIPAAGVIAHADCAPGRKTDPGPRFDWRRLARCGRALGPPPLAPAALPRAVPSTEADIDPLLRRGGWTAPAPLADRLAAFRARFRPGASGPATGLDAALLAVLPPAGD